MANPSITHKFVSAVADGGDATLLQPSDWNDTHDIVVSAASILGKTSGAGAVEELDAATVKTFLDPVAADTRFTATSRILGRKTAGAGAGEELTGDEVLAMVTSASAPALAAIIPPPLLPGGRLTIDTVSVSRPGGTVGAPGSQNSNNSRIYYRPHVNCFVPIFDGTSWVMQDFGDLLQNELSDNTKNPAAVANDAYYDLFVWDDAGTLRLSRGAAWSAVGTRVTTLSAYNQTGIPMNAVDITNGPAALRGTWVGTMYVDSTGYVRDTPNKRMVQNAYNRVQRMIAADFDGVSNWTYSVASWRKIRNSDDQRISILNPFYGNGGAAGAVYLGYATSMLNSTGTVRSVAAGVSAAYHTDAIPAPVAQSGTHATNSGTTGSGYQHLSVPFTSELEPSIGPHHFYAMEFGGGADTQTWYVAATTFRGTCWS